MANQARLVFEILSAKQAYAEGRNITELLRKQKGVSFNTSEIIETAYDLQAGTYIKSVEKNIVQAHSYTAELAGILDRHLKSEHSLLDIGTGELTTLSLVSQKLSTKPKRIVAFDISWSRIYTGLSFAKREMGEHYERLSPFVGDIGEIPLLDKSVSITTSSHALEPNRGRLDELMSELFRVTKDKLILFEPCYEINSDEGKQRMDRLGYIKGIDETVARLGGRLVEKIRITHISNPLNPTVCFIITPPPSVGSFAQEPVTDDIFAVPGTNYPLERVEDFYFSHRTGLCFPVLKSVPILKSSAAILATALA